MNNFIVFALPRSRSYWLSKFLTSGDVYCAHDMSMHARSLEDIRAWFKQDNTGLVDTAAAPFWRLILRENPNIKVGVLRRDVESATVSWMRAAPGSDPVKVADLFLNLDAKLNQIVARVPNVIEIYHDELDYEDNARAVFEHLTGLLFDKHRWDCLRVENEQVNMPALLRYCEAFAPAHKKMAALLKQTELAALSRKQVITDGSVTFSQENLRTILPELDALFTNHMIATAQDTQEYKNKNWPLLLKLNDLGFLYVMVARSNGRIVAYRASVVAPSLDAKETLIAEHTAFYADPAFPGVGMKLARESDAGMTKLGVKRFLGRAGSRGDGPRLGAIFRRQGYTEFGQLYEHRVM